MNLKWYVIEPFNQKEVDKYDLNKNGVYALCTKQTIGGYKVRYVGQGNIGARLSAHISGASNNPNLTAHIKNYYMKAMLAYVSTEKDRDGIENFLYNKFKPKFNYNSPPGNESIAVNSFSLSD